jgi:hypothetical protein
VALIACDNPPPSAAATQEALSAIGENLRELDTVCRMAASPYRVTESLAELETQRDALAAQATANNVSTTCPHQPPHALAVNADTPSDQAQSAHRCAAADEREHRAGSHMMFLLFRR